MTNTELHGLMIVFVEDCSIMANAFYRQNLVTAFTTCKENAASQMMLDLAN
jgi:hypothetical protein